MADKKDLDNNPEHIIDNNKGMIFKNQMSIIFIFGCVNDNARELP